MKTKGFSLVETLVVISIIGVMSSIITPKVSIYLAKAKDTKVIADLSTLRMASQMYYLDQGKALGEENGEIKTYLTNADLEKIKIYITGSIDVLQEETNGEVTEEIGGSRDEENGKIKLGGKIKYTFKNEFLNSDDGVNLWLKKDNGVGDYTINNYKWEEL
ncbi:type II secretion system protein [Fusobacterium sp. MFO224]|uniref:type II secretion system protein n=1 Tax=Fusobacterium sp. MFO224 TaxID=3378070 RepID=UPI00385241CE